MTIFFCDRFEKQLQSDSYDAVMSINFFPLVATLCHAHQIPIWHGAMTVRWKKNWKSASPTIRIAFSCSTVSKPSIIKASDIPGCITCPWPSIRTGWTNCSFPCTDAKHRCDVSFIGHLYESPLQVLLYSADDYIKGYIEGILQAQLRVYGYYFIDELITDELLDSVNQSFRKIGQTSLTLNRRGLSFAIASEITNLERCFLLEQMGELFNTHFYTTKPHSLSDHVISLGP